MDDAKSFFSLILEQTPDMTDLRDSMSPGSFFFNTLRQVSIQAAQIGSIWSVNYIQDYKSWMPSQNILPQQNWWDQTTDMDMPIDSNILLQKYG